MKMNPSIFEIMKTRTVARGPVRTDPRDPGAWD